MRGLRRGLRRLARRRRGNGGGQAWRPVARRPCPSTSLSPRPPPQRPPRPGPARPPSSFRSQTTPTFY
ncbi:hypothetical protein L575_2646 [Bordetella pertussis STO1-SEAT-0007]|nr:hypothetical protein L575_2646 [Bordetella pertussis STO1-SEAT-0007]